MSGGHTLRRAMRVLVVAAFGAPWIVLPLMPVVAISWSYWALR